MSIVLGIQWYHLIILRSPILTVLSGQSLRCRLRILQYWLSCSPTLQYWLSCSPTLIDLKLLFLSRRTRRSYRLSQRQWYTHLYTMDVNDNLLNLLFLPGCVTRCLVSLEMFNIFTCTLSLWILIFPCMFFGSLSLLEILCWFIFLSRQVPNAGFRWYRR